MKTKVETHKIMYTARISKVETKRKTTPNLQGCGRNENKAHKVKTSTTMTKRTTRIVDTANNNKDRGHSKSYEHKDHGHSK